MNPLIIGLESLLIFSQHFSIINSYFKLSWDLMLWRANTQHTPGRNEINPGQETRPVAVCNYLAFHRLPPPLIAHYQPPPTSTPPHPLLKPPNRPWHRLILHSFFLFFLFFCCQMLTSNQAVIIPAQIGLLVFGYKWRNSEGDKTSREGRAWQERWAACMCFFFLSFCLSFLSC